MVSAEKAAHSAAWTIVTSLGSRVVGLVGTLLLTRFLAPAEVGEVSAASVIVITLDMFLTFGVGMYLVANPKAGRDVAFHATVIHVGTGLIAAVAAVALCRPLAPVFDAPGLAQFVPGLALAALIGRVAFMPERVLVRQMRFRRIGMSRALAEIALPVVAVATARAGAGGFALVWGNLARSTVQLCAEAPAVSWRDWAQPTALHGATLRTLISYGTWSSIGSLAVVASRRWDNLAVSRLFGPGVMGAYNLAYNLADVPSIQVGEQITDVLLSSLANMEHERRVNALVRASGLLSLVIFPLAIGLGAVAPVVTRTFLGERWWLVGPMLTILSAMAITRPVTGAVHSYLQVRLRVRWVTAIEGTTALTIVILLFTMGRVGPLWACAAIGVAFGIRLLLSLELLRRLERVPVLPILARQWRPLLASVPLAAAVLAVRRAFQHAGWGELRGLHAAPELVAAVAAGGLAYAAAALVIARSASRDLIDLGRRVVRRRRDEDA